MVNWQKMKMKINNILSANQQLPVSEKATGTNAFQIIKNVYPLPFKKNNPIFLILTACQIFFTFFNTSFGDILMVKVIVWKFE